MADDASALADLYEADGVAWAESQAAALRRRDIGRNTLDYDNLAEEIDDVGKNITRACRSSIARIIEHLLKLEFAPVLERERNERGWRVSVLKQRSSLRRELTPTLRKRLPDELVEMCEDEIAALLTEHLLEEDAALSLRRQLGYSWSEVTGDWWPEPR